MALNPGTKLGPYEIVSPLGAGGMGEVYRARDTRLGRDVAIKILPAELSKDVVRKQRFEREAKTVSQLNHPNICTLHDVGCQDGVDYLVMECVEGETLAKRLEKGPLPPEQALKVGAQIADALGKAHRAGIVHRDLKPGNVMLTSSGAKLLDFGLAKEAAPLASLATMTVTKVATPVTEEGTIVGTFQYMSPEQVEGKELDGRSDIFALGAVLYEMVTGRRAFEGKSQLSVASAILEKEPPPISTVKPTTPLALNHAIRKCLAKLPEERWQSASDLASELKWFGEGTQSASTAPVGRSRSVRRGIAWFLAGAAAASLVVVAVWTQSPKQSRETQYFLASFPSTVRDISFAPNGHTVVVVASGETGQSSALWMFELGSRESRILNGTDGASYPFWSPDSKEIGFFADGRLKKLNLSGGQVQTLCDAPTGRGGTWNKDGVIVFAPDVRGAKHGNLYRVLASGGAPSPISTVDFAHGEYIHRWPQFLPDGRHFLYLVSTPAGSKGVNGIFVGSSDSNEKRFIVEAESNAVFAPPGYLLFHRENALVAQPFDVKRLTLSGEPVKILPDVQYFPILDRLVIGVSSDGVLLAQTGSGMVRSQLVLFDRKGNELGPVGKAGVYGNVALAPNGRIVAYDRSDEENLNTDVWTYDLQSHSERRITFEPADDNVPVWSPDAQRILFASVRGSMGDIYLKRSDGTQEETLFVHDELHDKYPNSWSRDGKHILCTLDEELWSIALPEQKPSLFLKAPSLVKNGQFSPDGRWVAYASLESGKSQVYVTSFPEARGKWQVSSGGGEQPRWRGDGKELFYLSPDNKMMAVPVKLGATVDAGAPVALFQSRTRQTAAVTDNFMYDVSADGQRFLINTQLKQEHSEPMTVVLNWAAKLKK